MFGIKDALLPGVSVWLRIRGRQGALDCFLIELAAADDNTLILTLGPFDNSDLDIQLFHSETKSLVNGAVSKRMKRAVGPLDKRKRVTRCQSCVKRRIKVWMNC